MDEYDVLGGYVPSFVQHLNDTRARLGLAMELQVSGDLIDAGGTAEESADVHAPSSWTPAEHDAFFRAVSVRSRWRPDLIAACIPTKSEWDVWMYLETLEEGAMALAMQQDAEDVDMVGGSSDERRDAEMQVNPESRSDKDTDEDVCEPALEVSQEWIDMEERMAAWIVQEEHLASVGGDATADTEGVVNKPQKRKRGRPRGTGRGRAPSRAQAQSVVETGRPSPLRAHRSRSPESPSTSTQKVFREASTSLTQKREALMSRLEVPHLLVLDGILREGEEASKSRESSVMGAPPTEHGDKGEPHVHDVEVPNPSNQITAPQPTSDVSESSSNAVIDPVLLALSGEADPAERHSPSQGTLTDCSPAHVPVQGPSSLHHASSQPPSLEVSFQPDAANMFAFPPVSMVHTNPCPAANVESDLSLFSPRSRRRIQKRLYMRRKRAQIREKNAASEGVVDTGIEKLRPGKKAKSGQSETPAVSTSVVCSEAPSDAEMEVSESMPRKNKGGLTLPYKLKAQFTELGIDAAHLGSQEMDLLNLGALGKLMGVCSSLAHGDDDSELTTVQSIDAQLIRHLQAAMISFVTDVIHRAIVWREREIRLKQRSQAWRQSDHITIAAIEHAVDIAGARYRSHKEYFQSLGLSPVSANATETLDLAKPSLGDTDIEAADGLPRLSPHRDVYTPLIRTPSEWRTGALTCLMRTYEREATRTRRGPSADIAEEDLMSDGTDEEALEVELEEEEQVDAVDEEQARREEARLWAGVRRIKD